jgi:Mn2+/Fe2+ NRAMP family transporter
MVFVLLLVNRRDLMGQHVNGRVFNIAAWAFSGAMIVLTLLFAYFLVVNPGSAGQAGSILPLFVHGAKP